MEATGSYNGEIRKPSSRRWQNLKQQTFPSWQPIYSAKTLSPVFLAFGLIILPIGVVVFIVSNNIQEIVIDYTDCISMESKSGEKCSDIIRQHPRLNCTCILNFEINKDLEGVIRMYYGLTGFYQNHRTYVESKDENQLLGKIGSIESLANPSKSCAPFDKDKDGLIMIPCGAIANSMFNDTIKLFEANPKIEIRLIRTGIAWESDKKYKFRNPKNFNQTDEIWKKFTKPRDWNRWLWDLDKENEENNGLQNEDFIIWMRPAALSNFRKLYRKVDSVLKSGSNGLPKGNYFLEIQYEYEVKSFQGTKSIILSESSKVLGGRNPYLGIATITGGVTILVVGLIFLLSFFKRHKKWKHSKIIHKNYGSNNITKSLSKYGKSNFKQATD